MFPPGTRGRARGLPYTMDAFMLGMGMLGESGWDLRTLQGHHGLGALEACTHLPAGQAVYLSEPQFPCL